MYHFNQQERIFLLSLCCILFIGSAFRYLIKTFPNINNMINVVDDQRFYPKININTADHQSLVRIPYIGEYTADRIIEYRERTGGFRSLDELKNIRGIRSKNFDRFAPYLRLQ